MGRAEGGKLRLLAPFGRSAVEAQFALLASFGRSAVEGEFLASAVSCAIFVATRAIQLIRRR